MSNSKPVFEDLNSAIERLDEVLKLEKNPVVRDSAIKRFEICFDLCWKSIKNYAKNQGVECYSPRSCFKTAFQLNLIDYEEKWLKMVDDRNLTTHLYSEEYADTIYLHLPEYLEMFKKISDKFLK